MHQASPSVKPGDLVKLLGSDFDGVEDPENTSELAATSAVVF